MNKSTVRQFLKSNTTHRLPKLATLAVTSTLLVALVAIDASASPLGRVNSPVSQNGLVNSPLSALSGLEADFGRHHRSPTAPVTTTTTASAPGGPSGPSGPSSPTTTTTQPVTTTTVPAPVTTTTNPVTTTTSPAASTAYPIGTADGSEPSGYAPPSASALAGYSQTYVTDFPGSTLPSAWGLYSGQPGGDPGALFSPSHVTVSGGLLNINTFQDPANGNEWVTGGTCLCNVASQTYGAYFVRSRLTGAGPTGVALLWPSSPVWPPEVDFSETGGTTNQVGAFAHYITSTNPNAQIANFLSIDMTQWHTWGVIWTPTTLTYTVDGRAWATVTTPSAIPDINMFLSLQSQTWCSSNKACPTSAQSYEIDWVAVYSPTR